MKMRSFIQYSVLACIVIFLCESFVVQNKKSKSKNKKLVKTKLIQPVFSHPPYVYIYKTKEDYAQLVPMRMNDSLNEIVSYLHPSDLGENGKFLTPLLLKKGYLLDRQGIGKQTVFLNYSYQNYSAFNKTPKLDSLIANIKEKKPFLEIWNCGCKKNYKNIETEINAIIQADSLKKICRPIFLHQKVD